MCREYASGSGWKIVAELSENNSGAPGASFELPQFNQVKEMAQDGLFDVLVVRELDRLSRKIG